MSNRQLYRVHSAPIHGSNKAYAEYARALAVTIHAGARNGNLEPEAEPEPAANEAEVVEQDKRFAIRATWKRWLVLFLYMLNSGNKAFQWIVLSAITQKLTYYYEVDNYVINATSILFMLTYVFLTYPACFIIEAIGVRNAVLIGSSATTFGSLVRCFSCQEHYGIYLLFLAQTIVSLGEQLIYSVPSRLASVWFPDHQVSTAVGLCIFGNQLGVALGFLLPQYLLYEATSRLEIGLGLYWLNVYILIVSGLATLGVMMFFDEAPECVPGRARLKQLKLEIATKEGKKFEYRKELIALYQQMRVILRQSNFLFLAATYGINSGTAYAVATLLNQMLEIDWPGDDIFVGIVGFIIIITGVLGSLFWGPILDRSHKYLLMNIIITFLALVGFLLMGYVMCVLKSQLGCYLTAAFYGIFQTGFMVASLDMAVELTYPVPELVSSSLMNVCPQIWGILAIFVGSFLVDNFGLPTLFGFYILATLLAMVCLLNVKEVLLRQEAARVQQQMQIQQRQHKQAILQME